MREIKLRAYLKNEKRIVDVISLHILVGFITYYDDLVKEDLMVELADCVLLRCTEMEDKYRIKIYEGDLVMDASGEIGEIYWDGENGRFWSACENHINRNGFVAELLLIEPEIIGSIYEYSKLLRGGTKEKYDEGFAEYDDKHRILK